MSQADMFREGADSHPHWHVLKNNPNDLPPTVYYDKNGKEHLNHVYVAWRNSNGKIQHSVTFYLKAEEIGYWEAFWGMPTIEVLAWMKLSKYNT